jgi:TonB-linked SusC/RagA family outer membrane protein
MMKTKHKAENEYFSVFLKRNIYSIFFLVIILCGYITTVSGKDLASTETKSIQQEKKITGTVIDKEGLPITGAIIKEEGISNGTTTDIDGKFTLTVKSKGVLQISYMGYKMQEIQIKNQRNISVVLAEDLKYLEEVVVVGYGQMRRKDLTGSIEQVKMDDLMKAPVKSFDDALAGRVSGIQVLSGDGQPGSLPNIIIRGGNSLTQDNSPLYVIDGFPIENNDNNTLNPGDIASIDILKDASATAIYGARGANGVIMITTKQGKAGTPVVNYNTYVGWQDEIKKIEVMNPYEFVRLQLELNPAGSAGLYLTSQGRTLEDYRSIEGIDWYEKVTQTAPIQSHSISMTGGTKQTKYSFSGSYYGQEGIFIHTGYRRYQGRMSVDQTIGSKARFRITANYADSKDYGSVATNYDSGAAGASLMTNIWGYRPILTNEYGIDAEDELVDPNINPNSVFRVNPLMQLENELREKINQNFMANSSWEYKITAKIQIYI